MDADNKKVRIVKANHLLQAKVGMGPVDEKIIEKCQKLIDNNEVDFAPLAKEYIECLESSLADARENKKDDTEILQEMIAPIMQLKANAKMFDYELVGNLANIMLNFLETIETIDKDVIEITEAHQKTVVLIIDNQMKGNGGEYGAALAKELKEACRRYFTKQANTGNIIEDKDAFFIDG